MSVSNSIWGIVLEPFANVGNFLLSPKCAVCRACITPQLKYNMQLLVYACDHCLLMKFLIHKSRALQAPTLLCKQGSVNVKLKQTDAYQLATDFPFSNALQLVLWFGIRDTKSTFRSAMFQEALHCFTWMTYICGRDNFNFSELNTVKIYRRLDFHCGQKLDSKY